MLPHGIMIGAIPLMSEHKNMSLLRFHNKRKSNYFIGTLLVLNIALLGYVGHALFVKNVSSQVLGSENVATLSQYKNDSFGFQMSYPYSWSINEQTKNIIWIRNTQYQFDFSQSPLNTDGAPQVGYRLQVRDNELKLSLADWLSKQKDLPKFDVSSRTLSSGLSAVSAITAAPTWKARVTYFVALDASVLEVSFFANSVALAEQQQGVFEDAFATLASTRPLPVHAQTFQNGLFGFLLDYPTDFHVATDNTKQGSVVVASPDGTMILEASYGAPQSAFSDSLKFAESRGEEFARLGKTVQETKVHGFDATIGTYASDGRDRHYYYVATSRGYFTLRVKVDSKTSLPSADIEKQFLDSFRVYELVPTKGWTSYASGDGSFTFLHAADASIKDLSNGVEVTLGVDPTSPVMGMYKFDNFDLAPLGWIDNRQLNKYRAADSQHLLFQTPSLVDGKNALRTADAVGGQKIAIYVNGGSSMYVIDLKPFDAANTKALAQFNTILESLKLR